MNNNDPHKRRKKINHEKEKKESKQKKKENHEKGNFHSLESFFCLLVFGQDKIQREERGSAHSLERAIERERERENTLAQANERARECASNRGLCADRVLRVLDMNFGVWTRVNLVEREGGEERRCWGNLLGCHIGEAFASLFLSEWVQVPPGAIFHDQTRELRGLEMRVESGEERMIQRSQDFFLRLCAC